MNNLVILNDVHVGTCRQAGTTPATQTGLKDYIQGELQRLLTVVAEGKDLLLLGDLFDGFEVEVSDLVATYHTLSNWIYRSNKHLYLVQGNHDYSPRGSKVSSFHALAQFLLSRFPKNVTLIDQGLTLINKQVFVIPHMPNQDLFDMELNKAFDLASAVQAGVPLYLLTHCNVMPPACHGQRDHSLNIDEPRAIQLTKYFEVLNAHEHQHQFRNIGRGIHCLGNQIPTSVADCLAKGAAQADGLKYAYEINSQGVDKHTVWDALAEFARLDWRDLDQPACSTVKFVRIEGTAKAEEASLVVDAIAKYRTGSTAFVVSNAVRIDGQEGVEEAAAATFEGLQAFDVLEALLGELNAEERHVIEMVMSERPKASPAVAKFLEGVEA